MLTVLRTYEQENLNENAQRKLYCNDVIFWDR